MKMRTLSKLMLGGLLASGLAAMSVPAYAVPTSPLLAIGAYEGVAAPTQAQITTLNSVLVSDPINGASTSVNLTNFGDWQLNSIGLSTGPIPNTSSNNLSIQQTAPASPLWIFASLSGIVAPPGGYNLNSFFTSNTLPNGWTAVVSTVLDPNNNKYGVPGAAGTTTLFTHTFSGLGTSSSETDHTQTTTGPYSITAVYEIIPGTDVINGRGNLTTSLTDVPEPFSLSLLAMGLLGLTVVYRLRRQA